MDLRSAADPYALTTDAAGDNFFSVAGRRAIVVGGEARGIDEIRVLPNIIARALRIAGARATGFRATRLGVERTLALGDTVLTETIAVAADLPGALIEISASQSSTALELHWRVPALANASVAAQGARVTVTRANRTACVFEVSGATADWQVQPATGAAAGDVVVTCRLKMLESRCTLAIADAPAGHALEDVLARTRDMAQLIAARTGALSRAGSERLVVHTSDARMDAALAWAQHRLRGFMADTPGVGTSMLAGHGVERTRAPARTPLLQTYRTRASVLGALALLGAGDAQPALAVLQFLAQYQDETGRVPEDCNLLGDLHYDDDAGAFFLLLAARYAAWTGDVGALTVHLPVIARLADSVGAGARADWKLWSAAFAETALLFEARGSAARAEKMRARAQEAAARAQQDAGSKKQRVHLSVAGNADARGAETNAAAAVSPAALLGLFSESLAGLELAAGHGASGGALWQSHALTGFTGAQGAWSELHNGLPALHADASADDTVSTALVLLPFVHGILGAEPDAAKHRLVLRPQIPQEWTRLDVEHLRMGEADIALHYERAGTQHTFVIDQRAGGVPVRVIFEPMFTASALQSAVVDGVAATLDARAAGERLLVPVQVVLDQARTITFMVAPPTQP